MPLLIALFPLIALIAAEIAAFIVVGDAIGVLPTVLLVFALSAFGLVLMRRQGLGALLRIRSELDQGRMPGEAMGHAAMIVVAGTLLIIPGFVTDAFGLLLFVPAVRTALWRAIGRRLKVRVVTTDGRSRPRPGPGPVVDLDPGSYSPVPETPPERLPPRP
jgi:UPF0716 protein FxsA